MQRVLFVDDEPYVLNAFRRQFAGRYEVHCASCGAEALDMVRRGEPLDVLVTDIHMSGMSGLELAAVVHHSHPELACILLSGHELADGLDKAFPPHVFRLLRKPCCLTDLEDTIREATQARQSDVRRQGRSVVRPAPD